jgi:hypothetical protein
VAVSVLVGESLDSALKALGGVANGAAQVAELSRGLRSPSRDARALAMARILSEVALAVDASRLA